MDNFYRSIYIIAQIMKNIIKNNLYIESYKILYALENGIIYNNLIYDLSIHWDKIKEEHKINDIKFPKFVISPYSKIITLLEVMDKKIYVPDIRIKINVDRKYKTVKQWNKYVSYLCKYFGIDTTPLCRVRLMLEEAISLYEYKEIVKLFLLKNVSMD